MCRKALYENKTNPSFIVLHTTKRTNERITTRIEPSRTFLSDQPHATVNFGFYSFACSIAMCDCKGAIKRKNRQRIERSSERKTTQRRDRTRGLNTRKGKKEALSCLRRLPRRKSKKSDFSGPRIYRRASPSLFKSSLKPT